MRLSFIVIIIIIIIAVFNVSGYLKLHTLHNRRYLDALLFLIQIYVGSEVCPSLLETVSVPVPTQ
jgi:hypothetical protein